MKHHRSPTHSYPVHAALAQRHPNATSTATPTLLSPLRSIANTLLDDFQSNAWFNACPPLAGLGISCPPDVYDHPFVSPQVDGDQSLLSLPAEFASRFDQRAGCADLDFDSDFDPPASDIIGLIPDVNMYDRFRPLDLPPAGVNPLDTICDMSFHSVGSSCGDPPSDNDVDHALSATDSKPEQSPSPRVIQDIMSILVQPAPEFSFPPWSSVNSPSAQAYSPSQQPELRSCTSVKLEQPHAPDRGAHSLPTSCDLTHLNTSGSSPVLNAHLGIELGDLMSRAERFKTKHPEKDIDRAWLSHFAGKLSDRGELLNDFRCYVIGCDQRNKRRDHILVHVGAHIGQRPFACSVCPLRFLRKNECKRHEASHSGFRPYSCDLCGQSFVRQDLVKRHLKRKHGLKDEIHHENQSGTARPPKKRVRL